VRILLVDDQVLFRQAVASLLGAQPDIRVVGEAGSVREAIAAFREHRPDIVLMDFSLPDGTGLDATQVILAERPDTRIVFLTVGEGDDRMFAAIRAGAKGYLQKNVPVAELLAFIRGVGRGEMALTPAAGMRILDEFARSVPRQPLQHSADKLTPRELEVLRALASGASNSEIAEQLVISENTVKNHIHSILAKLHLRNRREATKFARTYQP
jgi:DNA-binding NarL/FixJ family response regulator